MTNQRTEAALLAVEQAQTPSDLYDALWTCLNIIEDYSVGDDVLRAQDALVIHRAVMRAQEIARKLEVFLKKEAGGGD